LRKQGLLRIQQNRGRDRTKNRPGIRNDANAFDISPFSSLLEKAQSASAKRKKDRAERKGEKR